ncbi:MAG: pimeloyl-ACP methyl ester carboxylesterase, partial [Myxococcota bacterium]
GSISCALAYYRSLRKDLPFIAQAVRNRPPSLPETLIIFGAKDPIMPVVVGQMAKADIEGSRLELIADAGHFPQSEQPAQFNALLTNFLGSGRALA